MEVIRRVVNGTDLKNVVNMPNSLINKKVEILIFPLEEKNKKNKKSLSGFLSKYAKPELIEKEEGIWLGEAKE